MTWIRIDPTELEEAASLLRAAADNAVYGASILASCCCCPMPANIAALANSELTSIRGELSGLGGEYAGAGAELSQRAGIATADNLSAVGAAAWGEGAPVAATNATSGTPALTSSTMGGAGVLYGGSDLTIIVPSAPTPAPAVSYTTIGGAGVLGGGSDVSIVVPSAPAAGPVVTTGPVLTGGNPFGTASEQGGTQIIVPAGWTPPPASIIADANNPGITSPNFTYIKGLNEKNIGVGGGGQVVRDQFNPMRPGALVTAAAQPINGTLMPSTVG